MIVGNKHVSICCRQPSCDLEEIFWKLTYTNSNQIVPSTHIPLDILIIQASIPSSLAFSVTCKWKYLYVYHSHTSRHLPFDNQCLPHWLSKSPSSNTSYLTSRKFFMPAKCPFLSAPNFCLFISVSLTHTQFLCLSVSVSVSHTHIHTPQTLRALLCYCASLFFLPSLTMVQCNSYSTDCGTI